MATSKFMALPPAFDTKTQYVKVTPSLARSLLIKANPLNRRSEKVIDRYAGAMRRGEWKISHQGIAFDINGMLVDGHHRLYAIERAGVPVVLAVTHNVAEDAVLAMDQGWGRTLGQVLQIAPRIAQVMHLAVLAAIPSANPTAQQVNQLMDTDLRAAAEIFIERCGSSRRYISTAPVRLVLAIRYCINDGNPDVQEWLLAQYVAAVNEDYPNLATLVQTLLRQIHQRNPRVDSGTTFKDVMPRAYKAFDPKRQGEKVLVLSDQDGDRTRAWVRDYVFSICPQLEEKP